MLTIIMSTLFLAVVYLSTITYTSLFLVLVYLCAVATLTCSAVHGSYGRPTNLVSSIKSIRNSFLPLLSTFIVLQTIFISTAEFIAVVPVFVVQILQALGLIEVAQIRQHHILYLVIFTLVVLITVLMWLQVNCSLAYVVAVVESKWGFETLRRSANLLKGKRLVALTRVLFYGIVMGLMVIFGSICLIVEDAAKDNINQWSSFGVILPIASFSMMGFVMMNQYIVGSVKLYMQCKDLNRN